MHLWKIRNDLFNFQEISDLSESSFYIWTGLEPATEYEFHVAMQNHVDVGPSAYKRLKMPLLETGMLLSAMAILKPC